MSGKGAPLFCAGRRCCRWFCLRRGAEPCPQIHFGRAKTAFCWQGSQSRGADFISIAAPLVRPAVGHGLPSRPGGWRAIGGLVCAAKRSWLIRGGVRARFSWAGHDSSRKWAGRMAGSGPVPTLPRFDRGPAQSRPSLFAHETGNVWNGPEDCPLASLPPHQKPNRAPGRPQRFLSAAMGVTRRRLGQGGRHPAGRFAATTKRAAMETALGSLAVDARNARGRAPPRWARSLSDVRTLARRIGRAVHRGKAQGARFSKVRWDRGAQSRLESSRGDAGAFVHGGVSPTGQSCAGRSFAVFPWCREWPRRVTFNTSPDAAGSAPRGKRVGSQRIAMLRCKLSTLKHRPSKPALTGTRGPSRGSVFGTSWWNSCGAVDQHWPFLSTQ